MQSKGHLAPVMLNQLARYSAVLSLLEDPQGTTMLEVGSGSEGVARFLRDDWDITVSDLDFSDYGAVEVGGDDGLRRVEADVTELPFRDRQFDVVLALDLLEHLPAGKRPAALAELARVTRSRLIVGCPCGPRALRFDRALARWYRLLPGRSVPPWLVEHLDNGFPATTELSDGLAPFGTVELHDNEWLWTHLAISMLEAVPLIVRGTLRAAAPLGRRMCEGSGKGGSGWLNVLRGGDRSPAYRKIAVLTPMG